MKKLFVIAAVLAVSVLFTTCAFLEGAARNVVQKPEVTLKSVEFSAINFEGLTLLTKVNVKNNNAIDIPLPKIDWDLSVIDNPFVNGVIESNGSLKSRETTEVSFPVSFKYADLIKTIAALNNDNARYKIKMLAHIPVPALGDLSFPLEHEGKVPLLRLPEISVASAPATKFTYGIIPNVPTGATISFAVNVKNTSNIAVALNDLSYEFKINNTSLSKGGIDGKPQINAGATEKISLNFSLTASDIIQLGASVLQGNFKYNFTGNYKFGIPEFPLLGEVGNSFSLQ